VRSKTDVGVGLVQDEGEANIDQDEIPEQQ
jgi:hypothetical protein